MSTVDLVTFARAFAYKHHKGQIYAENPYTFHLEMVVHLVRKYFGEDSHLIALAYLHDVLEDCVITSDDLKELNQVLPYNVRVALDLITDKPGKNRKEIKQNTYAAVRSFQISGLPFLTTTDLDYVNYLLVVVKNLDRMANVQYSRRNGTKYYKMYQAEHKQFMQVYRYSNTDNRAGYYDVIIELQLLLEEDGMLLKEIINYFKEFPDDYMHYNSLACPHSYRGYYVRLGLEPIEEVPIKNSTLVEMLINCIGRTFSGWKGGDFTMDQNTVVHMAFWGHTGDAFTLDLLNRKFPKDLK